MSGESPNLLSIAVVSYHSPQDELLELIESLLAAVGKLKQSFSVDPVSLFLIDNSEDQGLSLDYFASIRQALSSMNIELRLLQGHGNIGYASGHNMVLRNLNSEFHLILNPDVVLEQNSLLAGIQYLKTKPDTVLVSPRATDGSGQKQFLCKRYPTVLTFLIRGFLPSSFKRLFKKRLANYEMQDLSESDPSTDVPIVSGCFMLCRTDAFREVGGFDDEYFLYFEDFDLSLRMRKEGNIAYLPNMKIQHKGGNAGGKGLKHILMFAKSGIRFFNSHGWRFFRQ